MGDDGLDWDELAADIAAEASVALELCGQIAKLGTRIHDLYLEMGPEGVVLSAPGVGKILAAQVLGRLGDPHRFTSLAAARSFSGLVPQRNSSGLSDASPGLSNQGDARLRQALYLAADHARKTDPTLAARYKRLMCQAGHPHNSATCTILTVLLTRIVACLRTNTAYKLSDVDGTEITPEQGRAIVADRYQIPDDIRAARRTVAKSRSVQRRRDERAQKGIDKRSKTTPVPMPAWTHKRGLATVRNSTASSSPVPTSSGSVPNCMSASWTRDPDQRPLEGRMLLRQREPAVVPGLPATWWTGGR